MLILLSVIAMKKTTDSRQILHILYMHVHSLDYKIISLTLLKQIKFTKQTCAKLNDNLTPSAVAMCHCVSLWLQ